MTAPARRIFLIAASAGTVGLSLRAQAQALVDEKDPQAVALGYVADATKVNKAKYKQYAAGQVCSNCALYQGGAAASGGCALFPGKQVAGAGWCSAYAKKA